MKKLQALFAATLLVAGLAGAVGADACCKQGAECCKGGSACCEQQGTKSGWFTGAGTVAKMDNKAGGSCCADKKMDNKAGASCCDKGADSKKMDNKAGGNCCGDKK